MIVSYGHKLSYSNSVVDVLEKIVGVGFDFHGLGEEVVQKGQSGRTEPLLPVCFHTLQLSFVFVYHLVYFMLFLYLFLGKCYELYGVFL